MVPSLQKAFLYDTFVISVRNQKMSFQVDCSRVIIKQGELVIFRYKKQSLFMILPFFDFFFFLPFFLSIKFYSNFIVNLNFVSIYGTLSNQPDIFETIIFSVGNLFYFFVSKSGIQVFRMVKPVLLVIFLLFLIILFKSKGCFRLIMNNSILYL